MPVKVPLNTSQLSFMQVLKKMRQNVLEIIPEVATRQPIISGGFTSWRRWHMVMEPDALKRVLQDRHDDYPKSLATVALLQPVLGNSILLSEGGEWRRQRRTTAPVFTMRNVQALGPIMTRAAEHAVRRMERPNGVALDASEEMTKTTYDIIADVTFSARGGLDPDLVFKSIDAYMADAGKVSLLDILNAPSWVPRPRRLAQVGQLNTMMKMADAAIEDRARSGPSEIPDLLDLLLNPDANESHEQMSAKDIRDNLLTFIVAGHETTALALSWAIYLCSISPEVQKRASEEARAQLDGRIAEVKDVEHLPFIRAIIDETLRLYPPAAFISRTPKIRDVLAGREVRKGDSVMIPIYALHRSHLYWDDPDAFRPERWDGFKPKRYTYLPFGDGPRICIGASFAIQEAVIILASLLSRFRFEPVAGKTPTPQMILTLRPEGGVWVTAHKIE
jgi:cytochrome P450